MPDLRAELAVSLPWRVSVWTHRATPHAGDIATIHMDDAVAEIAGYEPRAVDGTVTRKAVWELLVRFDDEDEALGQTYGWRAFVLLDRPREAPDDFRVVTGVAVP